MTTGPRNRHVFLQSLSPRSTTGTLALGNVRFKCALGRGGLASRKREGDGATPLGAFPIRKVYYRADRVRRPCTPCIPIPLHADDGWCDAPADRNYNCHVRHPYPASAEHMWRADGLYDVVVVLGHNDRPRVRGLGSAIFMHVAREGYQPTAGCLAVKRNDLLRLLSMLRRSSTIHTKR